ncbi:MAG: putative AGC family protein kinase [Streblomastix strix]|uniref:non-specific serine/threonine protein kinase n=1 Tax=Streblomastix strix TaxID=222440 RepID=A0A5J4VDM4_9EUKA|nr:MAG: putative AGC family protein kinase [Streblomastix strix]
MRESGIDANDCSSSSPCKTLNADAIVNNINAADDYNVYIYDKTTLPSTLTITQTSPVRRFVKDSTSLSSFSDIIINETNTYFNVSGSILFEKINFIVSSGGTVECHSYEGGGIMAYIHSGSILTIDGQCQYIDCYARYGGGIYINIANGSIVLITSQCQFLDCYADYDGVLYASICNSSSLLTLEDCLFKGCHSRYDGGGAFFYSYYQGVVLVNKIIFENCNCIDGGGGICLIMEDNSSKQVINGSTFTNCRASNGGGIYIFFDDNSSLEFINTTFFNCTGNYGGGMCCRRSVYNSNLIITSDNLIFKDCSAQNGGGIFIGQYYVQIDNYCISFYSSNQILIDNCSASECGGGIYCSNNINLISLNNMIINNCRAPNGGGIYINANFSAQFQFIIDDVLIKECQANSNQYQIGYGGGIFLLGDGDYDPSSNDLDLRGMKIYNNSATNGGQSLYVVMINRMERLGKGAFGEVRKAIHKLNGQIVAWKEMSYYSNEEKLFVVKERDSLQNAYDEIKLNFPNQLIRMVQPLGFFLNNENDMAYIVMEYCERGDLRKFINNQKNDGKMIDEEDAWAMITELACAVYQLHSTRRIHGDLKCENVLLTNELKVKLADFALTRQLQFEKDYTTMQVGTILYQSPELLKRSNEGERSKIAQTMAADIWAMGVICYEILSQKHPFVNNKDNMTLDDLIKTITESNPPELQSQYSDRIKNLINKMLIKDVQKRFTINDIIKYQEIAQRIIN